ncbi:MAG: hypothetical protein QM783_03280 [Phycisphaerales bacterium]
MGNPAAQSVPRCPRCGYDQSGACPAWRSECPLEGTCPECGLSFTWADAFNPWRIRSHWLFEHKRPRSLGIIRATRSWLAALYPPGFWKRITLTHACSWSVLLWPLVLIVSWAVVWSTAREAYELKYGLPIPTRNVRNTAGRWVPVPPTLSQTISFRSLDAWGNPWYPVNIARWDPSRKSQVLKETWAAPLAVLASSVVTGLTFLTLTSSRRLCGVKRSHVLRAMVYRLVPLGVFYLLWMISTIVRELQSIWMYQSELMSVWVAVLLLQVVWGVWWWGCAFRRGWKMPDATPATALLGIVDVLAFVVTFLLVSPYTAGHAMT